MPPPIPGLIKASLGKVRIVGLESLFMLPIAFFQIRPSKTTLPRSQEPSVLHDGRRSIRCNAGGVRRVSGRCPSLIAGVGAEAPITCRRGASRPHHKERPVSSTLFPLAFHQAAQVDAKMPLLFKRFPPFSELIFFKTHLFPKWRDDRADRVNGLSVADSSMEGTFCRRAAPIQRR